MIEKPTSAAVCASETHKDHSRSDPRPAPVRNFFEMPDDERDPPVWLGRCGPPPPLS